LTSPFRTIIEKSSRPLVTVPERATGFKRALLAYDGTDRAREALFVATYFAEMWKTGLIVFTAPDGPKLTADAQNYVRRYLEIHEVEAEYIMSEHGAMDYLKKTVEERNLTCVDGQSWRVCVQAGVHRQCAGLHAAGVQGPDLCLPLEKPVPGMLRADVALLNDLIYLITNHHKEFNMTVSAPRWDMTNVYPSLESKQFKNAVKEYKSFSIHSKNSSRKSAKPTKKTDPEGTRRTARQIGGSVQRHLRTVKDLNPYIQSFVATDSRNKTAVRPSPNSSRCQLRRPNLSTQFRAWVGKLGEPAR
jgi:hypothetical protein